MSDTGETDTARDEFPEYNEVNAPDAERELPADSFDPEAADFETEGGCDDGR